MYRIKVFNNISEAGLKMLPKTNTRFLRTSQIPMDFAQKL